MFSGEHLPLSTYLTFIVFTSLLLIYCYLCCDALVSVPVKSPTALYCLGHILLPVVWWIVGPARRSRLLKCFACRQVPQLLEKCRMLNVGDDHGFTFRSL